MRVQTLNAASVRPSRAQVLFLLYHYFNAKEIYNAIRVFIAAYVWMTGFGAHAWAGGALQAEHATPPAHCARSLFAGRRDTAQQNALAPPLR